VPRKTIATPERIRRAALARVSRYGFRRTSMEDIASEAGVSRAALYLQFRNKDEIFRSVSRSLQEEAVERATAAADEERTLEEKLQAVVEAKILPFVEITHDSPHGSELHDETNRLCGDIVAEARERFLAILTKTFRRALQAREIDLGPVGLDAAGAAELFLQSVHGLKERRVSGAEFRKRLGALVRVFVAGVRVPPVVARKPAPRAKPATRRAARR